MDKVFILICLLIVYAVVDRICRCVEHGHLASCSDAINKIINKKGGTENE